MLLARAGGGAGIRSQKVSRNGSRPKLFMALPKNMPGETSPAANRSAWNTSPAASRRSASSRRRLYLVVELLALEVRIVDPADGHRRDSQAPAVVLDPARAASKRKTFLSRRW